MKLTEEGEEASDGLFGSRNGSSLAFWGLFDVLHALFGEIKGVLGGKVSGGLRGAILLSNGGWGIMNKNVRNQDGLCCATPYFGSYV